MTGANSGGRSKSHKFYIKPLGYSPVISNNWRIAELFDLMRFRCEEIHFSGIPDQNTVSLGPHHVFQILGTGYDQIRVLNKVLFHSQNTVAGC